MMVLPGGQHSEAAVKIHCVGPLEEAPRKSHKLPKLKLLSRADADEAYERIRQDIGGERGPAWEELVSTLFRRAGALTEPSPASGKGADLAVWIDELQPIFNNPILVEVKAGRLDQTIIDIFYYQTNYYLI